MTGLALRAFVTLFVVMEPVGLAPLFMGLASGRDAAERRRIAARAVVVAAGILAAFAVAGAWLLGYLGISLDAFRVAGGALLFRLAVDMVFAHHERETPREAEEARSREDVSVFPLAIPLIAGPGALASVMILAGEARRVKLGLVVVLGAAVLVLALNYAAMRLAEPLCRLLGHTGVNVVTRVLGVLLAALAVQYVADGARGLLQSTQSATNRLVSPRSLAPRFDANTSRRPSGENIGKPSKAGSVVTRSRPSPSSRTMYRSKFRPRGSGWFEENRMRRPSGWKYGANEAAPSRVTCRLFDPSLSMTQISRTPGA
jgi:multiple antibiotic resistance protein